MHRECASRLRRWREGKKEEDIESKRTSESARIASKINPNIPYSYHLNQYTCMNNICHLLYIYLT